MSGTAQFEVVRKLGLRLPNAAESTTYGKPSLKIDGKMFACMASHKSAEPDSLAVRVDFDRRSELLVTEPRTYYITDHYRDYPAVLVRLQHITPDALEDLLKMAYRLVARQSTRQRKKA